MSEHDFCVWLEGFLAARGTDSLMNRDLGFIAEVLARTKPPVPVPPAPVQVPLDLKTDKDVLNKLKEAAERQAQQTPPRGGGVIWPQSPREPQRYALNTGCPECGMGKDGTAIGYVCPRLDCPSKLTVTCGTTDMTAGLNFTQSDTLGVIAITSKVPE